MGVVIALVPVTLLVVLGYFVWFAANKTDGSVKTFGKYLSVWVFILAALILFAAAVAPRVGIGFHMRGFGHRPFAGHFMRSGPGADRIERFRLQRLRPADRNGAAQPEPQTQPAPASPPSPPSN